MDAKMQPEDVFKLRDAIIEVWRNQTDSDTRITLLQWTDKIGEIGKLWARDRACLTNLQTEAFAAAPRIPAGGFGAARGVVREMGSVVSFHAEVAARHPR